MEPQQPLREADDGSTAEAARGRLLAGLPVRERRLRLAGISTAVLEGGAGHPLVLLHGPGEFSAKWRGVIPPLVETHRVVAPDLPGHGETEPAEDSLDAARVLQWLGELIERTCSSPPTLVGQILGGAIAARFAAAHPRKLAGLVLSDALGLAPFQPAPEFGLALTSFLGEPTGATYDRLWGRCAFDLESLRDRMGERWTDFKIYNVDHFQTTSLLPSVQRLMEQFGMPAIPPDELAGISVPTALIWGRHDLATDLAAAEAASARYGWPLQVVENAGDDPPMEQPEAFLEALRAVLDAAPFAEARSRS